MSTECTPEQLEFHALGGREIVARFDGGRITFDGGGLLLREADLRIGLLKRLAACLRDHRNRRSIEHDVRTLVSQRVYADLACLTGAAATIPPAADWEPASGWQRRDSVEGLASNLR